MRKIFLLLLIVGTMCNAQIVDKGEVEEWTEIGKWSNFGTVHAKLSERNGYYCFGFQDARYTRIYNYEQFCFEATEDELKALHKRIADALDSRNSDDIRMDIGDERIQFSFPRGKNVVIEILIGNGSSRYKSHPMTAKRWDKMFGM